MKFSLHYELLRNENLIPEEAGSQEVSLASEQGQHLVLLDHCGTDEIHSVETVNTETMYIKENFL